MFYDLEEEKTSWNQILKILVKTEQEMKIGKEIETKDEILEKSWRKMSILGDLEDFWSILEEQSTNESNWKSCHFWTNDSFDL